MQEKTMILDSKLFNKIYTFLKHPLVTLGLGLSIPLAIGFFNTDKQEPSYYFSTPQLLAESNEFEDKLKILWEEEPVTNVHYVDLTIWNNGAKYIDPTDFIKSAPIVVYNDGEVKILAIQKTNISRSEIKFGSTIEDSLRTSIEIFPLNDETLEQNDGFTYHILYSNSTAGPWKLDARIKGMPEGFKYLDLAFNEKGDSKMTLIILWSTFFFLMLSRIIVLAIAKKTIVFRSKELVFFLVLLVCTTYMTIEYYFNSVHLLWYK
ncbi:hypothetical protein SAMN04488028_104305 [Reichenbachiella agariperforans]|uniref:Uncharacterized protein n=1 Tax=Reichenbachiella agariperforans TaxID=156994 RepID=A0A1M6RVF5_REIAG|nr:hypothetical protein [Reichenbachiella agariperforans]SHK36404.1 hypothetical protein SAMN04488028_104305 [Reichenbachiella agariperforans]